MITFAYNLGYPNLGISVSDPLLRGLAYFMGWLMACSVSGAHFNPATSLAVYMYERKKKNTLTLFGYILFQFLGALGGILMAYGMVRYWGAELYPNTKMGDNDLLYFYLPDMTLKFWRIILQEIL